MPPFIAGLYVGEFYSDREKRKIVNGILKKIKRQGLGSQKIRQIVRYLRRACEFGRERLLCNFLE